MAWYTRNFKKTGEEYKTNVFEYTNNQHAATMWYHDHTMGMTRVNIYSGLAGLYLIRDKKLMAASEETRFL
jgi:spore coat protein A